MKKVFLRGVLALTLTFGFSACMGREKNISVIAREKGSGTREAFDKVITDGNGNFLEMKDENGKKAYKTTLEAIEKYTTGDVKTSVGNDKNAIGYVSLGALDDTVKVVTVNGVAPNKERVLDGSYAIQRPFVIMTNATVTLTPRAADFLNYLQSAEMQSHAESAEVGCIYLSDPEKRAREGDAPVEVAQWANLDSLPDGEKIKISGSSSMEKLAKAAMKGYAAAYGVDGSKIFSEDYQGSSVGLKDAENDTSGNVIALSSTAQTSTKIKCFNVCLDAVAVVVNQANTLVSDLTIGQLYDIYSGKIKKFSELA
ncbi:MAG: substrate-binding domain-containing protein [Clostridia bacterium]|nr:substrate-binding domain-containing protein [Clostridia bacterium]